MRAEFKKKCKTHVDRMECPDMLLEYARSLERFGIIVHDGGSSMIIIKYCPWCGTLLF